MAGDWIKVRITLDRDPAVQRIACVCGATVTATVGALVRFWCWANENTETGHVEGLDTEWLDAFVSMPGFGAGMVAVGWLQVGEDKSLTIPRWTKHNTSSAKRRAKESLRKRNVRRGSAQRPHGVRTKAAQDADKVRPREEKRREEKISTPDGVENPLPPSLDTPDFRAALERWKTYRVENRKGKFSLEALVAKLEPFGSDVACESINTSMANGWTGLFPEKARANGQSGTTPRNDAVGTAAGGRAETSGERYRREQAAKSWD